MSNVTHPQHYNSGNFEVIEVIEDQELNFHLGNAIKYICRAGKKDPSKLIEDLQKACWYLQRHIENLVAARDGRQPVRPNDMHPRRSSATAALNGAQLAATAGIARTVPPDTCPDCGQKWPDGSGECPARRISKHYDHMPHQSCSSCKGGIKPGEWRYNSGGQRMCEPCFRACEDMHA